jgi:hypothetical protein
MAYVITSPLYFVLDGVPSHTTGWKAPNILRLNRSAPVDGTDGEVMPGADGEIPYPLYGRGLDLPVSLQVFGEYDGEGNAHASPIEGLEANLTFLAESWGSIPGTTNSTRELVVHRADGSTRTGPVQVRDFDWSDEVGDAPFALDAVLRLYVPAGHLPLDA